MQQSLSESRIYYIVIFYRSSHLRCLIKISLNSQENTCTRVSFLIKLQASGVFLWIFTEHIRTTASGFIPFIKLIWANQFFLVLSVRCMREVFLLVDLKKLWCTPSGHCFWYLEALTLKFLILNKFFQLLIIVDTLYLIGRNIDFVFDDP